ncbi:thymidylate synthase [Bacteroides sp.]|uniref:thymidylate synthase n=1 Tax=Bacteroides sp. TaxID=29523 RepID=UPI00345D83A6
MYLIRAPNCARAHELAIAKVLRYGILITTEDNEQTLELDEDLNIFIKTPLENPRTSQICKFGENGLKLYRDNLIHGDTNKFEYTYHDQLFHYGKNADSIYIAQIDQIQQCINHLKTDPTTRRAQAITWTPGIHPFTKYPPCLQRIQFTIRPTTEPKVNMYAVFRSNDILSALGQNMYALTELQKWVADQLNIPVGTYSHTITVPHIYHIRDENLVDEFKNHL